jgi:hypothetical protein
MLMLAALLTLAACASGDESASDQASDATNDEETDGDTTLESSDIDRVLALFSESDVAFAIPEIAILREWADGPGTMVLFENPRGQIELFEFETADGLAAFLSQAGEGAVSDLPGDAAGWTDGRVLIVLAGAVEQPELVDLLTQVLRSEGFALGQEVILIVDSGTDGPGAGPDIANPMPPMLVAGTDTNAVPVGLGSYCWSGSDVGACADYFGIITGLGTLLVANGEAVFLSGDFSGVRVDSVSAMAWPLSDVELIVREDDSNAWSTQEAGVLIPATSEDNRIVLTADLPAGEYLVSIQLRADRGDALYGLLLRVEGGE